MRNGIITRLNKPGGLVDSTCDSIRSADCPARAPSGDKYGSPLLNCIMQPTYRTGWQEVPGILIIFIPLSTRRERDRSRVQKGARYRRPKFVAEEVLFVRLHQFIAFFNNNANLKVHLY